jgi:hypothetical protein
MPIDRTLPKPQSRRDELSVATGNGHVVIDDPMRDLLKPNPELDKERAAFVDDVGRSLLDSRGLIPAVSLAKLDHAQHQALIAKWPHLGPASIAAWQEDYYAGNADA